jgi:hypothetical protein
LWRRRWLLCLPGSALVVWNGLKNVPKEQGRALTQPFILVVAGREGELLRVIP